MAPKQLRAVRTIPQFRVKYKDIFDMKQLYDDLHLYLEEKGWTDIDDGLDHYETSYLEKVDMSGGKEIWIKWRPQRIPNGNPYYRYWLDISFHCINLQSAEVVKDGKKLKVHKGEVEIGVRAVIELDVGGKWSKHWLLNNFQKLFREKIYGPAVDDHKKELYRESYEFHNIIKQWFKLKRYLPYEEVKSFYTSQAWPSHVNE